MLNIKHMTILGLGSAIFFSNVFAYDTKENITSIPSALSKVALPDINAFPPISAICSVSSVTSTTTSATAAIKEVASPIMSSVITTSTLLPAAK